ncbi:MAG: hydrogenase nickel incorporation protein HypB [Leptolyngbyaceae cyanobacterium bins.59]|nr:hydrogenase nickel incorporation protein HypB [Leptolyngbyaceae cyanobacterium bins.59]
MCVTCGCSDEGQATLTNPETGQVETIVAMSAHASHEHTHLLPNGTVVTHSHTEHSHHSDHSAHTHTHHSHHRSRNGHSPDRPSHKGHATAHATAHSAAEAHARVHHTTLTLEQNILAKNDLIAAQNRGWFKGRNILALNLVSSPGSGKTTLLTRTIQDLQAEVPISVIEGDQATAHDADRIRETGCPVVQINTGTGCHLEAAMVERGLQTLNPPLNSIVMIENVGNLVCPALFDLGEHAKVVILSVTEGEDKPIKYPHMFRASEVMVLTKTDLLPYVNFKVDRCLEYARQVNPSIQIFQVSATTGEGLELWYGWLKEFGSKR